MMGSMIDFMKFVFSAASETEAIWICTPSFFAMQANKDFFYNLTNHT